MAALGILEDRYKPDMEVGTGGRTQGPGAGPRGFWVRSPMSTVYL